MASALTEIARMESRRIRLKPDLDGSISIFYIVGMKMKMKIMEEAMELLNFDP